MSENTIKDKIAENEINKELNSNPTPTDVIWSFLNLTDTIKKDFAKASTLEKKKYVKFFFYGMAFMFVNMIFSLWALGFSDWLFYVQFIGGTSASIALAFVVSKIKDVIPIIFSDEEALKKLLTKIVDKLSP